jgi:hypothetical protein
MGAENCYLGRGLAVRSDLLHLQTWNTSCPSQWMARAMTVLVEQEIMEVA